MSKYQAFMGLAPKRIPHIEFWSCPDAETYITGVDFYDHPRQCRLKMQERYPFLELGVPATDDPIPRPETGPDKDTPRWGAGHTGSWVHGEAIFKTPEQVFAFSPLEKGDFTDWGHVVDAGNFTSEETIYRDLRKRFPAEWGDEGPPGSTADVCVYCTMFMWPLLTFGWELFLECCLDSRFDRIMDEFAEINRRRFRAMARLPIHFVTCHDDIVNTRGPVCSPAWMHRHVFPRYEEFWAILKAAGKEPLFMSDGNMTAYADDVIACGARGIITEPYTDFRTIARAHEGKNLFLAGEGDNRVLSRNDPAEIRAMVESMVDTAKLTGGYVMCVGNHIPWNVTPQGAQRYLDLCAELAWR